MRIAVVAFLLVLLLPACGEWRAARCTPGPQEQPGFWGDLDIALGPDGIKQGLVGHVARRTGCHLECDVERCRYESVGEGMLVFVPPESTMFQPVAGAGRCTLEARVRAEDRWGEDSLDAVACGGMGLWGATLPAGDYLLIIEQYDGCSYCAQPAPAGSALPCERITVRPGQVQVIDLIVE